MAETKLSAKACVACRGDEPKLTYNRIKSYLLQIDDDWVFSSDPDKIKKSFEFEDFNKALDFINRVGELSEKEKHHPNICIYDYRKVSIELFTHKIDGLHENDFIMAAKIDKL
jgi:4a-hydroxytetrahydrobiopterin dehydratase